MTVADEHLSDRARGASPDVVRLLFSGRIADVCGRSIEVTIPRRGCSLAGQGADRQPGRWRGDTALWAPSVRVAIDEVMAAEADPWVSPGQNVAFLSAFSGG